MDKEIKRIVKKQEIIHEFYCDSCGRFLGTSIPYGDGYYPEIGDFSINISRKDIGIWSIKKCFCDECREKFLQDFRDTLSKLGFKREDK